MVRIALPVHRPSTRRSGFTLIEILIVSALIALFSGIAIFAVQEMYDSNRRKAMFDETKQIGQAFHFAYEDLGFFPRINFLGYPKNLITFEDSGVTKVQPGIDAYGELQVGQKSNAILQQWAGPYLPVVEARAQLAQGQKGLVWMHIPDIEVDLYKTPIRNEYGEDPTLVRWPTDTWGNPYVLYRIVSDPAVKDRTANPLGLRLAKFGEQGNYLTAVVSYGENGYPGGLPSDDKNATPEVGLERLRTSALYRAEAEPGSALLKYTLRVMYPTSNSEPSLTDTDFETNLPQTIHNTDGTAPGILDDGSDDVYWKF